MDKPQKFALPSPNFNKKMEGPVLARPHFLTPSGMTLHARHQPPPMYGKRGATYPAKYLQTNVKNKVTSAVHKEEAQAEPQYCEACDMELQSIEDLRRHKAQHEKCPIDNCNYRGHPSMMDKHVATLHSSGLFDKFKKLSSPEEIAAWREERKRKYPTLENALLRQRAKEQREKRGERLEEIKSRFGKHEDRKRAQKTLKNQISKTDQPQNLNPRPGNNTFKRNNNKRRRKADQQKFEEKKQTEKMEEIKKAKKQNCAVNTEEDMCCDSIKMFRGTSKLSDYEHLRPKKLKETNVLTSLLGMYGSDDESEEETNESVECKCMNKEIINKESTTNAVDKIHELIENSTSVLRQENNLKSGSNSTHEIGNVSSDGDQELSEYKISDKKDFLKSISFTDNSEKVHSTKREHSETAKHKEMVYSDDEGPQEAPIERSTNIPLPTKPVSNVEKKDGENVAHNQQPSQKNTKTNTLSRINKQKSGLNYRARLCKQNTLLEKLLQPDIRHERNVLLQCVRYVCENNFFRIGEKEQTS
ncbi:nuclear fragile X mental retardation-interacting protein 1 [Ceratitis capitata]|uniref:nuclear fragile X mental retardation-interacting protein 1 n=1 Tax=Ceratitis capitata TaxID=7213 RepID=UPI000329D40C|nr:nuclear fragile X mental retardation-interacting protein 1 [Ceratitis capitata]